MKILETKKIEKIVEEIKDWVSIFIFSSRKQSSRELFEKLIKDKEILNWWTILVENLTWSRWKILFMAKKFDRKVVIWWYDFYFNLIGNGVKFDKLIIYDIEWPMKDVMKKDIKRYSI